MSTLFRSFGFLALAMAAAAAFIYFTPKVVVSDYALPSATQYESLITQALSDDAANNLRTEGAPQQAVVNGWTAKDLLTIIAKENADILRAQGAVVDATGSLQTQPFDQRISALMLIAVLAICWLGVSAPRQSLPAPAAMPQAFAVSFRDRPAPAGNTDGRDESDELRLATTRVSHCPSPFTGIAVRS